MDLNDEFNYEEELEENNEDFYLDDENHYDLDNNEEIDDDFNPSHEIIINLHLKTKKHFELDLELRFLADLRALLNTDNDLDESLNDAFEEDFINNNKFFDENYNEINQITAYLEQLNIKKKKLYKTNKKDKTDKLRLNDNTTLIIQKNEDTLILDISSLFKDIQRLNPDLYLQIPSKEYILDNLIVEEQLFDKKNDFAWTETNKDNLEISGDILIQNL